MRRLMTGLLAVVLAGGMVLAAREDSWISERVKAIRDGDTEGWRKIPWAASLLDAAGMAQRENRPMFIFSHEGNIDTGRC